MVGNSADHPLLKETAMNMTKQSISALRSKAQSAIRRADTLTTELCQLNPGPTCRVAADITACVDLMIADAVDYLCSAEHVLQLVEPRATSPESDIEKRPTLGPSAQSSAANDIALVARAEQKVNHSVDLLNRAQQMIDGDRTVWGVEIRHGALWDK
jgi:hypothetical protein